MISLTTDEFWTLYHELPQEIQDLADKSYALWLKNPSHPGLNFKKVLSSPDIYSARVGLSYRVLGELSGGTISWFWIGKHEVYDRKLRDEEASNEYSA